MLDLRQSASYFAKVCVLRHPALTVSCAAIAMMLIWSIGGEPLCMDHHDRGGESAPAAAVAHSCACHVPAHHFSSEPDTPGPLDEAPVLDPVDLVIPGYYDKIQRPPKASFPA